MDIEVLINLGYWVSSLGFLIATVITALAVAKLGKSALGSVFFYLFTGTAVFLAVTVFQKLGGDFFGIADESVDVWWHLMFYLALFSYYFGFKALVGLASGANQGQVGGIGSEKKWAMFSLISLVIIFIIPSIAEPVILSYLGTPIAGFGLHHFLSFVLAGIVGFYLLNIKKNIGQIGLAIATPMIIAMWSLALQHFWELLTESWKVIEITSDKIEGVEKIFLTITAGCIIYAVIRLKSFAKT